MSNASDRNRDRCSALADIIYGFVQEAVVECIREVLEAEVAKSNMPEVEVKPLALAQWRLPPSSNESSLPRRKASWVFRRDDVKRVVKEANDGVTADDVICALVGRRMKARRPGALKALRRLVKSGAIRRIGDKYYPLRRKTAVKPAQPSDWVVPRDATPISAALETPFSKELIS